MPLIVVRYHEITLKRGNRARFEAQLRRNVKRACSDLPLRRVRGDHGRLIGELTDESAWPALRERLQAIYGIANFSLSRAIPRDEVEVNGGIDWRHLGDRVATSLEDRAVRSFRVATKRADKNFPVPSPEINARVGEVLRERTGARVDLDGAETTVRIEVLPKRILWSVDRETGPGGLPVGTGGHVVVLLSGGIDSPVAAARMMRRGCHVTLVHCHSAPYLDRSSQEKCRELARLLSRRQSPLPLVLVPFGDVQKEIVSHAPPRPRVVLYRRMMLRIAGEIAERERAGAIVTGDSLSQVASQTLTNLAVVEEAATLPVFRPLIGMDKLEVTDEARALGSYSISVEPDQDCCSLFVPRHPATKAKLEALLDAEQSLDVPALVRSAVERSEIERYRFPAEDRTGA